MQIINLSIFEVVILPLWKILFLYKMMDIFSNTLTHRFLVALVEESVISLIDKLKILLHICLLFHIEILLHGLF